MERIKEAIENAKKPDSGGAIPLEQKHQDSKHKKHRTPAQKHPDLWNTIKKIIAVVLIFAASILWLRLDFMNQLELGASEHIHDGIEQARAEAKKRLLEKERFEKLILANLGNCQAAAEDAHISYESLMQKAVDKANKYHVNLMQKTELSKPGEFIIPKAVTGEAAKMLLAARVECQQIYDMQLHNGK
jgi:hypothetical protein